ncbi:uncharacterized protein HMPREF1541_07293 [Cyphellophora europaea CBS 101466]|uniref:Uncharacterized protein n=1 Tax=Cyphellophora europaea (strain CBS 101466) TaxID=1220924 RepID=W2RMW5_CYPE1|nr:uncharacterized protein HMPREF1541_07293 [Cyphellophora europaea CBS 101466]ETN37670.1 hypothetical protein HMPREF1541_07293 [Cyphellophora europaea CBS 101466]
MIAQLARVSDLRNVPPASNLLIDMLNWISCCFSLIWSC